MSSVADYTAIAANYGVSGEIDPSDHIFRFLREHPNVGGRAAADYFSDGRECAIKLRTLIQEQRPVSSVRILEFASGYGRVTRHLPKVIPEATLTACDIHAEVSRRNILLASTTLAAASHGIDMTLPAIAVGGPQAATGVIRGDWEFAHTGTLPASAGSRSSQFLQHNPPLSGHHSGIFRCPLSSKSDTLAVQRTVYHSRLNRR